MCTRTLRDFQSLSGGYKFCRGRIFLLVHLDKTLSTSESEEEEEEEAEGDAGHFGMFCSGGDDERQI